MLESVEKLRASEFVGQHMTVSELADAIEAEVAEKYMELPRGWTEEQAFEIFCVWPRWDDGSPCMFGDEFTYYPKYNGEKEFEVLDRLVIYPPDHVWNRGKDGEEPHSGGYYEWNYFRAGGNDAEFYRPTKRKPRTVEDVLTDFMADFLRIDVNDEGAEEKVFAKYAAELQMKEES